MNSRGFLGQQSYPPRLDHLRFSSLDLPRLFLLLAELVEDNFSYVFVFRNFGHAEAPKQFSKLQISLFSYPEPRLNNPYLGEICAQKDSGYEGTALTLVRSKAQIGRRTHISCHTGGHPNSTLLDRFHDTFQMSWTPQECSEPFLPEHPPHAVSASLCHEAGSLRPLRNGLRF